MPRGDWLRSLSPEERKRLSQKGAAALNQRATRQKLNIDMPAYNLDNPEDIKRIISQIMDYLSQQPPTNPVLRLLKEYLELKNKIDSDRMDKAEKQMKELVKEIEILKNSGASELLSYDQEGNLTTFDTVEVVHDKGKETPGWECNICGERITGKFEDWQVHEKTHEKTVPGEIRETE